MPPVGYIPMAAGGAFPAIMMYNPPWWERHTTMSSPMIQHSILGAHRIRRPRRVRALREDDLWPAPGSDRPVADRLPLVADAPGSDRRPVALPMAPWLAADLSLADESDRQLPNVMPHRSPIPVCADWDGDEFPDFAPQHVPPAPPAKGRRARAREKKRADRR